MKTFCACCCCDDSINMDGQQQQVTESKHEIIKVYAYMKS